MNTVGERLRMLRASRGGPTQVKIARDIGISVRSYNGWEGDRQHPNYESACLLADYFATTPEFILYGADEQVDARLKAIDHKLDEILKLLRQQEVTP